MPFIQRSPLEYPPNNADQIRRFEDHRPPVSGLNGDYKQFRLGDLWLDTSANYWWILCYKDQTQGIWRRIGITPGGLEFLRGDDLVDVGPDGSNRINVTGGVGIATTGDTITNTITFTNTLPSKIVQTVYASDATWKTITTTIPVDDTIPQQTEGEEVISCTITPTNAANLLIIDFLANSIPKAGTVSALFQDAELDALESSIASTDGAPNGKTSILKHLMISGTALPTTFKVRMSGTASTPTTVNGNTLHRLFGGTSRIYLTITEYLV
jgi:hypothetical protein